MGEFFTGLLVLTLMAGLSCPAGAVPGCFGPDAGSGRFAAFTGDHGVRLADGRVVQLVGIRDLRTKNSAVEPGARLHFYAYSPRFDRYGRLRAQVTDAAGRWWQRDFLAQGQAVADIATNRYECAAELYEAEALARRAGRGIWRGYPIYSPENVPDDERFRIVRGRVFSMKRHDGRVYLNFGADWKTDFTVTISPDDMKRFRHLRARPKRLVGQRIEVRGFVRRYHGPELELANPYQLVVLGGSQECRKFDRTGWICRGKTARRAAKEVIHAVAEKYSRK